MSCYSVLVHSRSFPNINQPCCRAENTPTASSVKGMTLNCSQWRCGVTPSLSLINLGEVVPVRTECMSKVGLCENYSYYNRILNAALLCANYLY